MTNHSPMECHISMKMQRSIRALWLLAVLVAFGSTPLPVLAKTPPGATNVDAAKAEVSATVAIAGIKASRLALDDDAALTDARDTLTPIYDRQESATKDALAQLKAAAGDKAKTAAAIAAIQAAPNEANQYFAAHADTKARIAKRVTIINNELKQIRQTPDNYNAALAKAGLAGAPLADAKSKVKAASQKAATASDADATDAVISARTEVRKLLSPKQSQALDALMGGK